MNGTAYPWTDAVGASDAYLEFQEHLAAVTDSERPVLILGERGTGKELAAQRMHYMSRRWDKPFVTLLCTALNPGLLEAELFGHEAGAFTGARERRAGYFERADQGTLFLDEVADMPVPLQDKLLRVLEYGTFHRVGGLKPVTVDVRVIAATNRDVREMAASGGLRPDLLDRLACEVVHVPPLREREEDRVLLARYFATKLAAELGRERLPELPESGPEFAETALGQLYAHAWPGNIRELKNVVERSLIRSRGKRIEHLEVDPFTTAWATTHTAKASPADDPRKPEPLSPLSGAGDLKPGFSLPKAVAELEKQALDAALRQSRHRQTTAASLLGLRYHQFRALYRKHMPGQKT